MAKATTHSLERTNPKGQPFIGTCVLCGKQNLPAKAALEPCENVRGLTQDEAVLEAIAPPKDADHSCSAHQPKES